MIRPVTGFLATDGTFFEHKSEARAYDADRELRAVIENRLSQYDQGPSVGDIVSMVEAFHEELTEYLHALSETKKPTSVKVQRSLPPSKEDTSLAFEYQPQDRTQPLTQGRPPQGKIINPVRVSPASLDDLRGVAHYDPSDPDEGGSLLK